jgi:hypothetical protein
VRPRGDQVARADQLGAHLASIAPAFYQYFDELMTQGFTPSEALELTAGAQDRWFDAVFRGLLDGDEPNGPDS